VRSATPLGKGRPSRNWGFGRLDVSQALRAKLLPDSHEPNDWAAAALAQRHLRPGAVVVASLGWAGDTIDAYAVDVPQDQVAAQALAGATRLPSLELGLEDTRMVGLCDGKYSCAYTSGISWRTPTTPLPLSLIHI